MNFKPIKLLDFLFQSSLLFILIQTILSLSLWKCILDYLPALPTHHLEAEATLSNNSGENHISFHTKDVLDSVKSESNKSLKSVQLIDAVPLTAWQLRQNRLRDVKDLCKKPKCLDEVAVMERTSYYVNGLVPNIVIMHGLL